MSIHGGGNLLIQTGTLAERFTRFDSDRDNKLRRSRDYSALTIPGILPREDIGTDEELPVPYSSMPAEGVTALAARMAQLGKTSSIKSSGSWLPAKGL